MSFYDDASLVFLPSGGAGKDGKAYSIKPVPEYGSELVTNGGFDTDSDWNFTNAGGSNGWRIADGRAICDTVNPSSGRNLNSSISLVSGKSYKVTLDILQSADELEILIGSTLIENAFPIGTTIGASYIIDSSQHSGGIFSLYGGSSDLQEIDNVSVREVIVDGDFTFSRGSNLTATRVDSNGLIEKGRENLLLYSNGFNNWTNSNTSETSGQSGYDGSSDAWLLTKTAASGFIFRSFSGSGVQTFSAYVKANASTWGLLQCIGGSNPYAYFDLGTGVVGSIGGGTISNSIEDVGGGWYRISLIHNTTISSARIYPAEANTASGTSGSIYIQDAQLEQGLVATEYIESGATSGLAGILEDSPRFDYSGGASCPSLLLEPSRTNLVTQSEYFGDTTWVSNYTLTPNYTTSPDGSENAYRVQVGTANGYLREQISVSSSTDYVFSFYAKRGSATEMKYRVYDFTNGGDIVNNSYYSQTSSSNWVRIEVPFTTAATTASVGVYIDSDGQGNGDFYVFGAQLEQGSYPTSYIPNHSGGSVTRDFDYSIVESLGYSSTCTFYYEFNATTGREGSSPFAEVGKDSSNKFYIKGSSENNPQFQVQGNGIFSGSVSSTNEVSGINKIAVQWSSGVGVVFSNGVKQSGTLTNSNTSENIDFITMKGNGTFHDSKQLLFFEQALSTADLEILTGATSYESFSAMATALNYTTYE